MKHGQKNIKLSENCCTLKW